MSSGGVSFITRANGVSKPGDRGDRHPRQVGNASAGGERAEGKRVSCLHYLRGIESWAYIEKREGDTQGETQRLPEKERTRGERDRK